jgi:hypothetical protein
MQRKLYQRIASLIQAMDNCRKSGNAEWLEKHHATLDCLVVDHMPRGSGIDSGCNLSIDKSNPEKLVFATSYHHMNDGGYYDGWTQHVVTVTPSLASGIDIRISGRDRNQIKEYLYGVFSDALNTSLDDDKVRWAA